MTLMFIVMMIRYGNGNDDGGDDDDGDHSPNLLGHLLARPSR